MFVALVTVCVQVSVAPAVLPSFWVVSGRRIVNGSVRECSSMCKSVCVCRRTVRYPKQKDGMKTTMWCIQMMQHHSCRV